MTKRHETTEDPDFSWVYKSFWGGSYRRHTRLSALGEGSRLSSAAFLHTAEGWKVWLNAGRSAERPVLSVDEIESNVASLKSTLQRLLESASSDGPDPMFQNNLVCIALLVGYRPFFDVMDLIHTAPCRLTDASLLSQFDARGFSFCPVWHPQRQSLATFTIRCRANILGRFLTACHSDSASAF